MESKSFPCPYHFTIFILSIIIYLPAFLCHARACDQPFHCGNLPALTLPFWSIGATQLPCRGHPALGLDCRGAVPFLVISGLSYRVLEIDFFSYTLKVARHDLWNNLCRPILLNTTLTPDVFQTPRDSNYTSLTLYYNCTRGRENLPTLPNQFHCHWSDHDHEVINLFTSGDDASTAGFACNQQIMVPVTKAAVLALEQSPSGSPINVLRAALAGGFLIQWSSEIQWSSDMVLPRILADTTPPGCTNYARSSSNCIYNASLGKTVCSSSAEAGNKGCVPPSSTPVTSEAPPPPPLMKEPSSAPSTNQEPLSPPQGSNHKSSNQRMIILGLVFGALALIAACVLTYWRCKDRCLPVHGTMNPSDEKGLLQEGSLAPIITQYKHSDIEEITNSFRDELGKGGYGTVYKGILRDPKDHPVAVKRLVETNGDGKDFSNEVASISRTSHKNIVSLLGFCNEENKRALVYEFMPNKSLDKFLSKDGNPNYRPLDKETLYKIAIGVAKGLQYLHEDCKDKIVHFDIKPQNILLDGNFSPKIADFGLARLCKKDESKVSVNGGRGTAGYMAPENFWGSLGKPSHKADVYSYGMVVLDMVGARNKAEMEAVQSDVNYFPDIIYEKVTCAIRDKAFDKEDETKMKMFLVGFWCIQTRPDSRPEISKVLKMLEGDLETMPIPNKPELF